MVGLACKVAAGAGLQSDMARKKVRRDGKEENIREDKKTLEERKEWIIYSKKRSLFTLLGTHRLLEPVSNTTRKV